MGIVESVGYMVIRKKEALYVCRSVCWIAVDTTSIAEGKLCGEDLKLFEMSYVTTTFSTTFSLLLSGEIRSSVLKPSMYICVRINIRECVLHRQQHFYYGPPYFQRPLCQKLVALQQLVQVAVRISV